jgi:hypothetical protein
MSEVVTESLKRQVVEFDILKGFAGFREDEAHRTKDSGQGIDRDEVNCPSAAGLQLDRRVFVSLRTHAHRRLWGDEFRNASVGCGSIPPVQVMGKRSVARVGPPKPYVRCTSYMRHTNQRRPPCSMAASR